MDDRVRWHLGVRGRQARCARDDNQWWSRGSLVCHGRAARGSGDVVIIVVVVVSRIEIGVDADWGRTTALPKGRS
jgi:hypothetical protein